jgi:hypothetical protein
LRNDFVINLLGNVEESRFFLLKEFSLAHFFNSGAHDVKKLELLVFNAKEQSPGEEVIANEDGYFIFPKCVDGEESASGLSVVYNIIVYKGCCMEEFD